MAIIRHFTINLVCDAKDRRSIKSCRKLAGWNPDNLAALIGANPRYSGCRSGVRARSFDCRPVRGASQFRLIGNRCKLGSLP
jgi:hypothetical protein